MQPKLIRGLVLIVLGLALLGWGIYRMTADDSDGRGLNEPIMSFLECKAAGYPIMESYPEQCRTPDGRTFVAPIDGDGPEN